MSRMMILVRKRSMGSIMRNRQGKKERERGESCVVTSRVPSHDLYHRYRWTERKKSLPCHEEEEGVAMICIFAICRRGRLDLQHAQLLEPLSIQLLCLSGIHVFHRSCYFAYSFLISLYIYIYICSSLPVVTGSKRERNATTAVRDSIKEANNFFLYP